MERHLIRSTTVVSNHEDSIRRRQTRIKEKNGINDRITEEKSNVFLFVLLLALCISCIGCDVSSFSFLIPTLILAVYVFAAVFQSIDTVDRF